MMQLEQKFIQALHALGHHRLHAPHRPIHEVHQSSTINALLEGVYDGEMNYDKGVSTLFDTLAFIHCKGY